MKVNLSDVEGFEVLPAGKYLVKVTDGELLEAGPNAKHPGSEYINWELTIQSGDYENRHLWTNTSISHGSCPCSNESTFNKALGTLKQMLKNSGKYTDKQLNAKTFSFEIDDLIGADFVAVVVQRPYEGEMRNSVKRLRPAGDIETAETSLLP